MLTNRRTKGPLAFAFFLLTLLFCDPVVSEDGEPTAEAKPAQPTGGFLEVCQKSGITFRMSFLPLEQGDVFKINLYDHGSGLAVGDYNGDGFDDVHFLNQLGANALYKNKGDGTFADVTEEAGVGLADRICVGATFSDYDNDGDQDLYVTSTRGGNALFQNQGNGKFLDVTEKAGLKHIGHSSGVVFFDYDNDGALDLFLCNTAQWTKSNFSDAYNYFPGKDNFAPDLVSSPIESNVLYRNNRDGTFADVTEAAGVKGKGWAGDAAVADYDEDGDLDIFISHMWGGSQLFRNEGNGTFTDVTIQALRKTSWGGIGGKFFDFNNDGHLDLFTTDMHSDMWMGTEWDFPVEKVDEKKKYRHLLGPKAEDSSPMSLNAERRYAEFFQINYDRVLFGNALFKNLGNGKFDELSDQANTETFWPWGVATGDFDNDGYEDAFVAAGMGYPFGYWRNSLLMNNGDGTFLDRCRTAGMEPPPGGTYLEVKIKNPEISERQAARSSRCAATADFDGDGRVDLIVNNFNDHPYLFENNFPRKNYVAFRLKGTRSNRDAIGTLVKLQVGNEVMARQVHAAGGYLSQSSKTLHFGLGDRTHIDLVEIRWPSGVRQTLKDIEINRLHEIEETP